MNHYNFDTKRTRCPYCGSSDGFAQVLHPTTNKAVGNEYGKCHSCGVFKTPDAAGFLSDAGELVVSTGVIEARYYDVAWVGKHGLKPSQGGLVNFAMSIFGEAAQKSSAEMLVYGDTHGNTTFLYADIKQRGMSAKTIAYDENGKRKHEGLFSGSRLLGTSQIAGYITPEGSVRSIRVSDGSYQLLYGQHRLAGNDLPVIIVESEKTAYLCSIVCKQAIFLATGGSKGLTSGKIAGLRKANAIPEELTSALAQRPVTICFDYDESGESGSLLVQDALYNLGASSVQVCNMQELLGKVQIGYPAHERLHSDLADVIVWAMCYGRMNHDVDILFKYLLGKNSSESIVERALEEQELQKITKLDHQQEPPKPSLTFTDAATDRASQLAIPGNLVMLLASPGVGKSSVISAIVARHVRPHTDAFGLDIHAPNGIVVVDTEQSKDQVAALHRRMAKRIGYYPEDMPDILEQAQVNWFVTNKKLSVEKQVENLFAVVKTYNPSFVIIDQIGSLVKSVNSEVETTALIKRIATDAEENMRTWIVVLHTNPTSDKGRGVLGSDIHRWAASVMFIKRPDNAGDPSLLTTNNADGTMAKIRAGAPVRCFFAWDHERGDFYPTQKTQAIEVEFHMVMAAIDEIFSGVGASEPLAWGDLRKKIKDMLGVSQGTKVFNYLINENLLKRQPNGKLWPDYEKLQMAKPKTKAS